MVKIRTKCKFVKSLPNLGGLQSFKTLRKTKTKFKGELKMSAVSMKQLLEAGVHFGHQTRKWNPKMDKYIFTARKDIHSRRFACTSPNGSLSTTSNMKECCLSICWARSTRA